MRLGVCETLKIKSDRKLDLKGTTVNVNRSKYLVNMKNIAFVDTFIKV